VEGHCDEKEKLIQIAAARKCDGNNGSSFGEPFLAKNEKQKFEKSFSLAVQ
jgi:hypothetical protein